MILPVGFTREHVLLRKPFVRPHFDSEKRAVVLTFHDEKVEGALKVGWVHDAAYIFVRTPIRHAGFTQLQGRAPIQWDDEQKCVFVSMGDLIEKIS